MSSLRHFLQRRRWGCVVGKSALTLRVNIRSVVLTLFTRGGESTVDHAGRFRWAMSRPMSSFITSFAPPKIAWIRLSLKARAMGYSSM